MLPKPLDPSEEELDPPELLELDEEDDDELEPDEPLTRLVAAANAEVAFGAEPDELLLDELELELDELEEELPEELELPDEPEESRPKPVRLPMIRGVIKDA